jgi:hypothetical protein
VAQAEVVEGSEAAVEASDLVEGDLQAEEVEFEDISLSLSFRTLALDWGRDEGIGSSPAIEERIRRNANPARLPSEIDVGRNVRRCCSAFRHRQTTAWSTRSLSIDGTLLADEGATVRNWLKEHQQDKNK